MSLKIGDRRCRCGACGEYFNSVPAFDRHRTGAYASGRRCLSTAEMTGRGMVRNSAGYWVTSEMPSGTLDHARRSGDRLDPAAPSCP